MDFAVRAYITQTFPPYESMTKKIIQMSLRLRKADCVSAGRPQWEYVKHLGNYGIKIDLLHRTCGNILRLE